MRTWKLCVLFMFVVSFNEIAAFYESNRMFLMDRNWRLRQRNLDAVPIVVERRAVNDLVEPLVDYDLDTADTEPMIRQLYKRGDAARFYPYVQLSRVTSVHGGSIPSRKYHQVL
ncbi:hypothetical protein M3Y94_01253900 [Aphelenchoides besseyi]|nr:hypothetical protein M3Y94_01253900 [Aphelenchoides besseyi]KAI6219439.1 hypothetical protein M3Y95_01111300 [Aphelenchoides besseyi]